MVLSGSVITRNRNANQIANPMMMKPKPIDFIVVYFGCVFGFRHFGVIFSNPSFHSQRLCLYLHTIPNLRCFFIIDFSDLLSDF